MAALRLQLLALFMAILVAKHAHALNSIVAANSSVNASVAIAIAEKAEDEALKRAQQAVDALSAFNVAVDGAAKDALCVQTSVAGLASDTFWTNFTGNRAKALQECLEHARTADKKQLEELKSDARKACETWKDKSRAFLDALKHNGTVERVLDHIRLNCSRTEEKLRIRAEHISREVERRVEGFYRKAERRIEVAAHKLDELAKAKKKLENRISNAEEDAKEKAERMKHEAESLAKTIAEALSGNETKKAEDDIKKGEQGNQENEEHGNQLAETVLGVSPIRTAFFALAAIMSGGAVIVAMKVHSGFVAPLRNTQAPPTLGRNPFEYPSSSSGKACMISCDGMEVRV